MRMQDKGNLSEAISIASDPMQLMQRVVDQALVLIPGADGALIALWDHGEVLNYVCGSGSLSPYVGFKLNVQGSLSGVALKIGQVVSTEDATVDPRVDKEACRRLGVVSSVCVPLIREYRSFGVLNVSASTPRAFSDSDALVWSDLADFVSVVVRAASDLGQVTKALFAGQVMGDVSSTRHQESASPERKQDQFVASVLNPHAADELASRQRIEGVIERQAFSFVLQPVINLETGQIFGYEALARFSDDPARTPDLWFAEAHQVGLGIELELAALRKALRLHARLPADAVLAVNAGPDAITDPVVVEMLNDVDARRVIVELTEHSEVANYSRLVEALARLRSTGARLAIDDTGAGVSSLAHILKLSPEFIKLDCALTTGIHRDPVRRALASSLVNFASEIGSMIVAEGIETEDELKVLRGLGIAHGQGYYLGRPAPLAAPVRCDSSAVS